MNVQRFALPALIAAALHAAFLFANFAPESDAIVVRSITPPPTRQPIPSALVMPPAQKRDDATRVVRPLPSGGPSRPTMPERSLPTISPFSPPQAPVSPGNQDIGVVTIPRHPWTGQEGTPGEWTGQVPGDIFSALQLDHSPRVRAQLVPEYPLELRRAGVEGSVLVEFEVDPTGQVTTARVVRGSHREFEGAAIRAVLKWKFEPGRHQGRAVAFRMAVPIGFTLAGN